MLFSGCGRSATERFPALDRSDRAHSISLPGVLRHVDSGQIHLLASLYSMLPEPDGGILVPTAQTLEWAIERSALPHLSINAASQPSAAKPPRVRSSIAQAGRSRDELLASAAKLRYFVVVLEEKGGVGKSVCTQTCYETLKLTCERVLIIDADIVNRNLSRVGLTEAHAALNARRVDFEGWLFEAGERLTSGEVDGVVIDSAAGGEESFRPFLPELARTLRMNNARLVVLRPVTTSPLVFDNILTFGRTVMTDDMGVLCVRNMSMGRNAEEFSDFDASPERQEMLRRGMVECALENAGVRYSDLATSFGRSFAQIALNEPEELGLTGRQLEIAKRTFTRPTRLFLARWLYRQTEGFKAGLYESVLRTLP